MKIAYTFIAILLISISSLQAQTKTWNSLLQKHVDNKGWVNYDGFKKDQTQLDSYLNYLEKANPNNLKSDNAKKAFWINAYNAYTIKLILNHYPLKSILDIKVDGKNAWETPFAKVGGKTYTLNHIEHEILRKQYSDPNIHVGVNCASVSCPALPNTAFTEKNIDALLTKNMKSFVNDAVRNSIKKDTLELSQIFNWFQDDFTKKGSLIDFINLHSTIKVNKDAKVSYKAYNWNLNKQ